MLVLWPAAASLTFLRQHLVFRCPSPHSLPHISFPVCSPPSRFSACFYLFNNSSCSCFCHLFFSRLLWVFPLIQYRTAASSPFSFSLFAPFSFLFIAPPPFFFPPPVQSKFPLPSSAPSAPHPSSFVGPFMLFFHLAASSSSSAGCLQHGHSLAF